MHLIVVFKRIDSRQGVSLLVRPATVSECCLERSIVNIVAAETREIGPRGWHTKPERSDMALQLNSSHLPCRSTADQVLLGVTKVGLAIGPRSVGTSRREGLIP